VTIVVDRAEPRALSGWAVIILIPLCFAILGLGLRYAAYASLVPDASLAQFPQFLCRWDCGWYVRMAETGYDPFPVPTMINAGNWAFFPLYPMFVGALRWLTGLPTMWVATAASVMLTWASAVIAWPLFNKNMRAYVLYCAFLLSGPFSFYFTTFYTEVMFLLFITCVFVALKGRHYLWAGIFAALLSATRIVGVFIVFAIVIQAYVDHRKDGGTLKSFITGIWLRPDLLLAIFIAPLGLFAYMAFLHYQVGDALAFSHVQRAWGRATGSPLAYLWKGLSNFPKDGFVPAVGQQLAVASLVGLALTLVLALRKQFAAAAFCAICIILPLFAGLASMLRFVVGLAPLSILLMVLLSRWWVTFFIALAAFLAADYFFTLGWVGGYLTLV